MSTDLQTQLLAMQSGNEQQLVADRETMRVGPFLAAFHRTDAMVWLNYATPVAVTSGRATPGVLAELGAAFAARGRTLRFEFIEALHPGLAASLEAAGLTLQLRAPLMVIGRDGLRITRPSNISIVDIQADAGDGLIAESLRTMHRAFGHDKTEATPEDVAEHREGLRSNRHRLAVAMIEGRVISGGVIQVISGELAGVGTAPEYRRRGAAAAVSSHLAARQFDRGAEVVWLSAGDEAARALYAKVGFADAGAVLNYIDGRAESHEEA